MTTDLTASPETTETKISPLSTLVSMFIEPSKAFASIEKKSMLLLPLLLAMFGGAILWFWYYQNVDISWLQDKLLTGKEMEPAQRAAAVQYMTKGMLMNIAIGGVVIGTPIIYLISAIYFVIVAKITNIPISFGKWFAFSAWISVPNTLALILGFMQIMLAKNGQLTPYQINPLSLNQLFFHFEINQPWSALLDMISVTSPWVIVLTVIGFQAWSKKSRTSSIAIVLLPYVVIYGVMAIINLMRTTT